MGQLDDAKVLGLWIILNCW